MVRNEEDVNASEERINWLQSSHDPPRNRFEEEETPKYLDMFLRCSIGVGKCPNLILSNFSNIVIYL